MDLELSMLEDLIENGITGYPFSSKCIFNTDSSNSEYKRKMSSFMKKDYVNNIIYYINHEQIHLLLEGLDYGETSDESGHYFLSWNVGLTQLFDNIAFMIEKWRRNVPYYNHTIEESFPKEFNVIDII